MFSFKSAAMTVLTGILLSAVIATSPGSSSFFNLSNAHAEDSYSFTVAGDYGANALATATLEKIKAENPLFNIAIGDLSYDEVTPESAWCEYVKSKVGTTFPFELVTGNHEAGEPPGGDINNFTPCLPHRMTALTGEYGKEYYFDYQGARYIQISPGFEGPLLYDYSKGTTHYNWTATAIDSARSAGIKWIIVSMHENCITMGDKTCDIGPDIINLLIEKKVDVIFQGHDHNYQRSKQLSLNANCTKITPGTYNPNCVNPMSGADVYSKNGGTVIVIVGTAGQGLYSVNTNDSESGYFAKWMGANSQARHGFVKVSVNDDTLQASFIGSTSQSSFIDSFTIKETNTSPTPIQTALPTTSPISSFKPIRLTTGTAYTDPSNNQWSPDAGIADGGETYTVTNTIANTTTPKLYQSERYAKDINYGFNVPNGTYQVKVKFAEIYFTQKGERVFNLYLNGNKVLDHFDILAEVAPFSALDKTFTTPVTDQKINVDFSTITDNAKVAALEITQVNTTTPSPSASVTPQPSFTTIRLNTGSTVTDANNNTWKSDSTAGAGGSTFTTSNQIANTQNQALFRSERYGKTLNYTFAVPNGNYSVNLNFAEIYFTAKGERVFNVDINNVRVLSNFDILTQTTPNTALTKSFPVSVTDGKITIAFTTITDNAKIASLEIIQIPSISPTPTATSAPTASPTLSPTASPTATPTISPAPSATNTPTPQASFTPIRLTTGSTTTDSQSNIWNADTAQNAGGETYTVNNTIANTTNQKLYQSERYAKTLNYKFTVPNGIYKVTLKFSEIYFTQKGERIFNVAINNTPALTNFDILAETTPYTALDKPFTINVTNGQIDIVFTTMVDNAKIASLEITKL